MRTATITAFCIFLCGCGLWQANSTGQHVAGDATQHAAGDVTQHAAEDDAKCVSYGAKRGDPTYVQCRVQLDAARTQAAAIAVSAVTLPPPPPRTQTAAIAAPPGAMSAPPVAASAPAAAPSAPAAAPSAPAAPATSGFAAWVSAFAAPSPPSHNDEIPVNYRELVRSALELSLRDPYTVRDAQIAAPTPMWIGLTEGGKVPIVCVKLNAKDATGAYAGIMNYTFVLRDGTAVPIAHTPYGCGQVAYQPFTEMGGETGHAEASRLPMDLVPR